MLNFLENFPIVLLVLVWAYLYLKIHERLLKAEKNYKLAKKEYAFFKDYFIGTVVPELDLLNKKPDACAIEEAESILWNLYRIDYVGAGYFIMEDYLFRVKSEKFSILDVTSNHEFLSRADSFRELLRSRTKILSNVKWRESDDPSLINFRIDDICADCGIEIIVRFQPRIANYPKTGQKFLTQ